MIIISKVFSQKKKCYDLIDFDEQKISGKTQITARYLILNFSVPTPHGALVGKLCTQQSLFSFSNFWSIDISIVYICAGYK